MMIQTILSIGFRHTMMVGIFRTVHFNKQLVMMSDTPSKAYQLYKNWLMIILSGNVCMYMSLFTFNDAGFCLDASALTIQHLWCRKLPSKSSLSVTQGHVNYSFLCGTHVGFTHTMGTQFLECPSWTSLSLTQGDLNSFVLRNMRMFSSSTYQVKCGWFDLHGNVSFDFFNHLKDYTQTLKIKLSSARTWSVNIIRRSQNILGHLALKIVPTYVILTYLRIWPGTNS